jgi:RNA polymerase sigma factor (sigma-70 family)
VGRLAPLAGLLRAAGDGDQEAWDAIVDRFSGLVWATVRAHRLESHEAADVVQTVWLRLVEHLGDLRDPDRLGGWLATTARRECLRSLRASGRMIPTGDEADLEPREPDAPGVDAELLTAERDAALWRAFRRISDRCQALLRMLMAQPAPSYDEVSAALAMPVGSIGPTRARCLDRLRAALEAEGMPPPLVDPA